jgi:hypothetical protein
MALNFLLILTTLVSCNTTDSDVVESQSDIYAHYTITAKKDSNRINGGVIFYEEDGKWFNDYLALRGNSHVNFQSFRMMEIRDSWNNQTSYEDSFNSDYSISTDDSFKFKYFNNDGHTFYNSLNLPSLAEIKPESIQLEQQIDKTIITFEWIQDIEHNLTIFGKKSTLEVRVNLSTPSSTLYSSYEVSTNPARIIIENTYDNIDKITLCSKITLRAKGLNDRDRNTSIYCDNDH